MLNLNKVPLRPINTIILFLLLLLLLLLLNIIHIVIITLYIVLSNYFKIVLIIVNKVSLLQKPQF